MASDKQNATQPQEETDSDQTASSQMRQKERFRYLGIVISYLTRWNIARKMLLGYISLVVLLVLISIFALYNLNRLNRINRSILTIDVPVIVTSDKMIDVILDEERYARRYAILKNPRYSRLAQATQQRIQSPGRHDSPVAGRT